MTISEKLVEPDLDARLGYAAWRGFITWAHSDPDMRAAFTAETGIVLDVPPPANPMEAMIDKATGAAPARAEAFAIWVSEQWGIDCCPPTMREAIRQKHAAGGGDGA